MKPRMLEMTIGQLREQLKQWGEKPFRADQLANWVYRRGVTDPQEMSNVPSRLAERLGILTSRVAARVDSPDGVAKLLMELEDGLSVETVLIPTADRATACVSTQVGCAMGCAFCATGLDGLARNLQAGEILEQLLHLRQATGKAITNVVFMGMGEPLANYDATVRAVRAIVDPERFGLSARHVTVSTVGLPDGIRRLAKENLPITLAISLHAPNDRLREELVPAARVAKIGAVIAAAREFYQARHREVTLEYSLIRDVNDSLDCAEQLADLAGRLRCNVNLIRYNPIAQLPFAPPDERQVDAFAGRLRLRGVNVTLRRSRGRSADAACGQLRRATTGSDEP